jgi:hypothetical protein
MTSLTRQLESSLPPTQQVTEVLTTKSPRRRILEAIFYLWGLLGMIGCLVFAHITVELELLNASNQLSQVMMVYPLIWIGGLVFTGIFALLAPVKVLLVHRDGA